VGKNWFPTSLCFNGATCDRYCEVQGTDEDLWEGMVTTRRGEFTYEFFQFLTFKLESLVRAQAAAATGRGGAPTPTTPTPATAVGDGNEEEEEEEEEGAVSSAAGGGVDGEVDAEDAERQKLKRARQATTAAEDAADKERDDLARLASRLISICEAYDDATRDQDVMDAAAENFKELLEVETLEDMNEKIEKMAAEVGRCTLTPPDP
jgi:hypothetical protein